MFKDGYIDWCLDKYQLRHMSILVGYNPDPVPEDSSQDAGTHAQIR